MISLDEGQYFGTAVQSTEQLGFKLSVTHYDKGSSIEAHCHANHYLSILTKGSYWEEHDQKQCLVKAGDIVFRPKSYVHRNHFQDQESTCFNIEFKKEWREMVDAQLDFPKQFAQYASSWHPGLFQILLTFDHRYDADEVLEILYSWLYQENQMPVLPVKPSRVAKETCQIIASELDVFHTLNSLGRRVFVHPIYLARAFKAYTGMTISRFQMREKLALVVHLLLNTGLKISDISFQCGFYDDAHLIRSFRSHYGISPHQFRLRLKS